MNPLGYLYIKFKNSWSYFGGFPRGAIVFPLWFIGLIGFGDIFYLGNKAAFYIYNVVLFGVLYLIIYSIIPKNYVLKKYKLWFTKYSDVSIFWSYLYFFSGLIIGFIIDTIRHPL